MCACPGDPEIQCSMQCYLLSPDRDPGAARAAAAGARGMGGELHEEEGDVAGAEGARAEGGRAQGAGPGDRPRHPPAGGGRHRHPRRVPADGRQQNQVRMTEGGRNESR